MVQALLLFQKEPVGGFVVECRRLFSFRTFDGIWKKILNYLRLKFMSKYLHYLNGRFVKEDELLISPRDLGFSRGFGVFNHLKTYNGRPFKLEGNLTRLIKSAELIGLRHSYSVKQLAGIVRKLLSKNNDGNDKEVRIVLSGGVSNSLLQSSEATLLMIVDSLSLLEREIYEEGVRLNSVKFTRYIPESKSASYIEGVRQTWIGKQDGFYQPLFYSDSQVYEAAKSNVFVVREGKIYTPKSNIFKGGTRDTLINDLKNELKIIEENFRLEFLLSADEVFLASSGKEIVSVVKVDKTTIGDGKVGEITKLVMKTFQEFTNSDKWQ